MRYTATIHENVREMHNRRIHVFATISGLNIAISLLKLISCIARLRTKCIKSLDIKKGKKSKNILCIRFTRCIELMDFDISLVEMHRRWNCLWPFILNYRCQPLFILWNFNVPAYIPYHAFARSVCEKMRFLYICYVCENSLEIPAGSFACVLWEID